MTEGGTPQRRTFRVSLRWKMLASFAGVFTVVYAFIAVWVYQYTGTEALQRLETQLASSSAGGATIIDPVTFRRLIETVPPAPDPSHPTGLGYPTSRLFVDVATQLYDIRRVITDSGVYTYYQDPSDGELYFAASAGFLLRPQIGARYKVPVIELVPPGVYANMKKGLTQTVNEPAYTDQFGSWISSYSPIRADDGSVVGAIGLDYPLTYVDEVQSEVRSQLFPVLFVSYVVLLVLVLLLATALARPLKRLTTASNRIAEGDYDVDLSRVSRTRFPDEMAMLAASFQVMVDRVAQRERSLTQEVKRLKVEIDHARRDEAVREITETDFFADLAAKAAQMRSRRRDDTST